MNDAESNAEKIVRQMSNVMNLKLKGSMFDKPNSIESSARVNWKRRGRKSQSPRKPKYECHGSLNPACKHKHTYRSKDPNNRHICIDCEKNKDHAPAFKARKVKKPKALKLDDLGLYSAGLRPMRLDRFTDLKPILAAEGKTYIPPKFKDQKC